MSKEQEVPIQEEANFDHLGEGELVVNKVGDEPVNYIEEEGSEEDEGKIEETDGKDYGEEEEVEDSSTEEGQEEGNEEEGSEEEEYEEYDNSEYYSSLTEESGIEIGSDEDVVAALQELRELKEAQESNSLNSLPLEAQMVANIISSGGDYRSKLRLLSLDTEGLGGRDLLKENFILNNESLASSNRELAEMQFEKDYENKYGILERLESISDPDERAEFESENSKDIKFAKLSLEQDVKNAKEGIDDFINESTTVYEDEDTVSDEEKEQFMEAHLQSAKETAADFEGIVFGFGENGEDEFVLGSNSPEDSANREEFLSNPIPFFKEQLGIDIKSGQITDYNSLLSLYELVNNYDKLPSLLGQYYMEKNDKQSIDKIIENRETPKTTNSKPQKGGQGIGLMSMPDYE